jgi:homocitrate synthase NifV
VSNHIEYTACASAGATAFITSYDNYALFFNDDLHPDVIIEINIYNINNLETINQLYDETYLTRAAGVRICGLYDIMSADYRSIFTELNRRFGEQISIDISNRAFTATATCLEWIMSGGCKKCCASFAGIGSGGVLEELLAALNVLTQNQLDLAGMQHIRLIFESLSQTTLKPFKSVAGEDIFAFESGIHAVGIFKNPLNYEPFKPESVGVERKLVIGKHSGREAVRAKLIELNLTPCDTELAQLNDAIRCESIYKHRSLNDKEVMGIYYSLTDKRSLAQ